MRAEIISIGEELLSGDSDIVDTNSIFITKALRAIGVNVFYKTTVGDHEQRIVEVIKLALGRVDVIITSGGLGPTVDDMTRQGIAMAVGVPLEFQQNLMDDIAEKFAKFGMRMSDNNRSQAMLPKGASAILNPVGTAPGFITEYNGKVILSVPGVPREMRYLIDNAVIPYLKDKIGAQGIVKTRVLRTAGIGESLIDEKIGDLERLTNPIVGLAAHTGQTDIRIAATGQTEAEADKLIAEVETEVRQRMGDFIFGVDKEPLEDAFITALKAANLKIALAEIGTDNLLYNRLKTIDGATDHIVTVPPSDLAAIRAAQPATTRENMNQIATEIAKTVIEQTGVGIALAVISESSATALAVTNGGETRNRTYAYGFADPTTGDSALPGGAEWSVGWGLSTAWYLVTSTLRQERK